PPDLYRPWRVPRGLQRPPDGPGRGPRAADRQQLAQHRPGRDSRARTQAPRPGALSPRRTGPGPSAGPDPDPEPDVRRTGDQRREVRGAFGGWRPGADQL